jgi:hypothetical protein
MYRGSFRAGSSTDVNMLGAQMQNPESHIKINPHVSSFVGLFVASVCRCLVVPVDETVDERNGYHFGSHKCQILNEPCRARTCDPLIKSHVAGLCKNFVSVATTNICYRLQPLAIARTTAEFG